MPPQLICVDPDSVEQFWPHVADLVVKAYAEHGTQDERRELEASVKSGKALLWIAWSDERKIEAMAITDLIDEDGYRVCRIRALAGVTLFRWFDLLPQLEQHGKDEGCKLMRYVGRRGWTALMPDYQVTHVIASKRLKD